MQQIELDTDTEYDWLFDGIDTNKPFVVPLNVLVHTQDNVRVMTLMYDKVTKSKWWKPEFKLVQRKFESRPDNCYWIEFDIINA